MGEKIVVLTEADEKVASGHLKECIVLTEELQKIGYDATLWINEDIPKVFLKAITVEFFNYCRPIASGIADVIAYLKKWMIRLVILNLRCVDNELILKIKARCNVLILCIDELGHRRLDCDIIVNPMIDENFGQYTGKCQQRYLGNKYLILPTKYHEWNQKEKKINDKIEEITISMGGVDINNTTLQIVNWLQEQKMDIAKVNVVLGGGYLCLNELKDAIKNNNFFIFQNIDYLDELFFISDVAFTAGGNTLHELACIGTSAVVIPTMPHEYRNGKAFEAKGFGNCYKDFKEFEDSIGEGFLDYFDKEKRYAYLKAGKACADGGGYLRMIELIQNVLNYVNDREEKGSGFINDK